MMRYIIHGPNIILSALSVDLWNFPHFQVGAIENPLTIGAPHEVGVWAGQDIRSRCSIYDECAINEQIDDKNKGGLSLRHS